MKYKFFYFLIPKPPAKVSYIQRKYFLKGRWMLDDSLLIWKLKQGSVEALKQIYEKYKTDLLKLALVLTRESSAAEDAVADVFVNFAKSAGQFSVIGNLRPYLMTAVANNIRNEFRRRATRRQADLELAENRPACEHQPPQWAMLNEELELLSTAMSQIPYEQREVVALYMQGDMSFRRIAAIHGVSVNTIKGRYRYGIQKLRSLLDGELEK